MHELQDKIDRLMKRYEDLATEPIESRHALELATDITEIVQDLESRIENIEGRLSAMNKTM